MNKNFAKISLFSILGLVAIAALTWKPLTINYGKWLAAGEDNPTGDLSVLLSGSNQRLETLIALYNQGKVKGIYYAGGIDEKLPQLAGYRDIFAKYDLPSDRLYCGDLVESTFDEAQTFQRKLKDIQQPVDKIVLVSDRYHLRRGIWSFQKVLGNDIQVTAYSTPSSPEIADPQWWKHPDAREQVIGETKKLAFYKFYYGLLGRGDLITHGDVNRVTKGKTSKGHDNPCEIVLPQLN
jgi:uncharacterized SAM-binding protein YcdF (DUF218 family)